MARDAEMPDADAVEEERMMYGHIGMTEEELDEQYPYRPRNIHKTLPFHQLYTTLFAPLIENGKKAKGPKTAISRRKAGPDGMTALSSDDRKFDIIDRFISRWRHSVGNDFYPALRLIVPNQDRDRPMYGLKEKLIAKLFVKIIGIDKNSPDADSLMNWKLPGQDRSKSAGDFGGRCFEVLSKRPILTEPGTMTVAEVNQMLDKLALASKEEDQMPIFELFYRRMNAYELMWLIRIMLRQMKIGASERSLFTIWHPDAETLFNVSSSLRRVCWELYDPTVRLPKEGCNIALMQCFQPQLTFWQMESSDKVVKNMRLTEEDDEFWIEEKLDGERIQLHMAEDDSVPGGKRFSFWSRKGKDYTYLYGSHFEDTEASLTQHLKHAFKSNVRNIILDGEMITWDMEVDFIAGFGTLKSAANMERRNPFNKKIRPLYRTFDCLYLNDRSLTDYTMRDRRKAMEASVIGEKRRLEIQPYQIARKAADIDTALRKVVAESTEGLVVKNPRVAYSLNERLRDWIKVKPEYMTEFGEDLDCVIVGGYYGAGHRGGTLASFLCGLLHDKDGSNPQKTWSFFKVGGGLIASDYEAIRHRTEGKWTKWDPKYPPTDWIELGGGAKQYERPDVWIKPEDSVVVAVKAASISSTVQFRVGKTLRFPRFKSLRSDKSWRDALSVKEFIELNLNADREKNEKAFKVDDERKKRRATTRPRKKPLTVKGAEEQVSRPYAGPNSKIFEGVSFLIISDSKKPFVKSKAELEQMVKANGGTIVQDQSDKPKLVCVSESNKFKAVSIIKHGKLSIVKPSWIFDCIEQNATDVGHERFLLPMEPNHMFHTVPEEVHIVEQNVDEFGDSYCRDVTPIELKQIFDKMPTDMNVESSKLLEQFHDDSVDFEDIPGWMFRNLVVYFDDWNEPKSHDMNSQDGFMSTAELDLNFSKDIVSFAGGEISTNIDDDRVTHIVVREDKSRLRALRTSISRYFTSKIRPRLGNIVLIWECSRKRAPRIVTMDWIAESFKERTLIHEDRFAPT